MNIFVYLAYAFIALILLMFIALVLSKIRYLGFFKVIASFLFSLGLITVFIYMIFFFGYLVIGLTLFVYNILKIVLERFVIVQLATYFALLFDLIFIAYFIEYVGYYILRGIEKLKSSNKYRMSRGYRIFVKMIKPKMFIYLLATIFTIIASIENAIDGILITHVEWNSIKPFLFEASISFIAFDGFINLLTDENGKFLRGFKKKWWELLLDYFGHFIDKNNEKEDTADLPK